MIEQPSIYQTPYGGQLTYILPGDNQLVVHLKDKLKIRNKKRWSMVSSSFKQVTPTDISKFNIFDFNADTLL